MTKKNEQPDSDTRQITMPELQAFTRNLMLASREVEKRKKREKKQRKPSDTH